MYIFRFFHETKKLLSLVRVEINNLEIQCKLLREIAKETEDCDESRVALSRFSSRKMKGWNLKASALRVTR